MANKKKARHEGCKAIFKRTKRATVSHVPVRKLQTKRLQKST